MPVAPTEANHIRISAVICTCNRADLLGDAIASLCEQTLDRARYEIMVIDNASTDSTPDVVKTLQAQYPEHQIRYSYEPQPGLSQARNTGYKQAVGPYVAYFDDDARADDDWLQTAYDLIETLSPAPDCVGGPILPFYNSPRPPWFKDEYEIRTWGNQARYLEHDETFYGSSMVWDKTVLEAYGGFSLELGVKGTALSLGEETLLMRRIWRETKTPRFYYTPQLKVYHWVPPDKMVVRYRLKRRFAAGQSFTVMRFDLVSATPLYRFLFLGAKIRNIAKGLLLALLHIPRHRHWQNWVVEDWGLVVREIGGLLAIFKINITPKQR
jgi:glycosyltransferase involved in cell wall biosynthesis